MDKQNTVVLASGGVNLAINLMLFYYVHRRTNLLNRKLDEILNLLNAMNKAAAPQPQPQRAPFPMQPHMPPHMPPPPQYMSQYGMYNPAAAAAMQAQAPPPPTMGNPGAVNNMAHTLSNMMDSMIGIGVRARPSPSTVVITEEKQQQSGGAADISNELRELQNEEISP